MKKYVKCSSNDKELVDKLKYLNTELLDFLAHHSKDLLDKFLNEDELDQISEVTDMLGEAAEYLENPEGVE